jgi:hypothetical protein
MKSGILALITVGSVMAAVQFLESGGSATSGLEFWSSTGGTVAVASSPVHGSAIKSIKLTSGATTPEVIRTQFTQASGRYSVYFQSDSTALNTVFRLRVDTSGGTSLFQAFVSPNANTLSVQAASNATNTAITFSANTWYRLELLWTITSTTVFVGQASLYNDSGATETQLATISQTNSTTLGGTSVGQIRIQGDNSSTSANYYFSDVYLDDTGQSSGSPGPVIVTVKRPNALSTNNFANTAGTFTNRWELVADNPLDAARNIYSDIGVATQQTETFLFQDAATGDLNVSTYDILGGEGYIYNSSDGTVAGTLLASATNSSAGTAGTTLTASLTASSGDLVVCNFADQVGGSAPTIADTGGNSYTALNTSTNTVRKSSWYSRVTASPGTITVTFGSSSNSRALACGRYQAMMTTPLDTNPADANDSTSPYDSPLSGTLAQTREIVLGTFALAGPGGDTIAKGASETDIVKAGSTYGQAKTGECSNAIKSTATSMTCSGLAAVVDDLIVVVVADQKGGTAPTVADDGSNSYTALTTGTNTVRCQAWYSRITTAMGTITVTMPNTNASAAVAAYRFSGSLSTPLDTNPAMTNDSTSPYTGPLSGTLAQANEILAGYYCLAGPGGDTTAASTNSTAIVRGASTGGSAGTNSMAVVSYQFQSATTSVQASITNSTNRTGITGTATFKTSGATVASDSTAVLTNRTVNATTSIQPQITNTTANRTGATGTASFKQPQYEGECIFGPLSNILCNPTASPFMLLRVATFSVYPSTRTIGMKNQAPMNSKYLEGGALIAAKPAAGAPTRVPGLLTLGVGPD